MKKLMLVLMLSLFAVPAHAQYMGGMGRWGWGAWLKEMFKREPQEVTQTSAWRAGAPRALPKPKAETTKAPSGATRKSEPGIVAALTDPTPPQLALVGGMGDWGWGALWEVARKRLHREPFCADCGQTHWLGGGMRGTPKRTPEVGAAATKSGNGATGKRETKDEVK